MSENSNGGTAGASLKRQESISSGLVFTRPQHLTCTGRLITITSMTVPERQIIGLLEQILAELKIANADTPLLDDHLISVTEEYEQPALEEQTLDDSRWSASSLTSAPSSSKT